MNNDIYSRIVLCLVNNYPMKLENKRICSVNLTPQTAYVSFSGFPSKSYSFQELESLLVFPDEEDIRQAEALAELKRKDEERKQREEEERLKREETRKQKIAEFISSLPTIATKEQLGDFHGTIQIYDSSDDEYSYYDCYILGMFGGEYIVAYDVGGGYFCSEMFCPSYLLNCFSFRESE